MYILRKHNEHLLGDNEYYVGGALLWSRFDIRAIVYPTLEDAKKAKIQLRNPEIEIKKWRDV